MDGDQMDLMVIEDLLYAESMVAGPTQTNHNDRGLPCRYSIDRLVFRRQTTPKSTFIVYVFP